MNGTNFGSTLYTIYAHLYLKFIVLYVASTFLSLRISLNFTYSTSSDIVHSLEQNAEQLLVPLVSPLQTKIKIWVEPFDERCQRDLRFV